MKLLILILTAQLVVGESLKGFSMYSPPWKHCIHQVKPEKYWQEIASPGYPLGITRQTQCSWIAVTHPPFKIKLAFDVLNLTGSLHNCYTQYVEYWEINTAKSMGKFCGTTRPGDYVSYGSGVRVDLKADTAGPDHVGFLLKYKLTREDSGYKEAYSFPNDYEWPSSSDEGTSNSKTRKPTRTKAKGGKINLSEMRRQREAAAKMKGNVKVTKKAPLQRPFPPIIPLKRPSPEKDEMIIIDEDKQTSIQTWILILIGAGAVIFFIIIGILSYICFCRKRKPGSKVDSSQSIRSNNVRAFHHRNQTLPRTGTVSPQYTMQCMNWSPGTYPRVPVNGMMAPPLEQRPEIKSANFSGTNYNEHVPQLFPIAAPRHKGAPPANGRCMYDQPINTQQFSRKQSEGNETEKKQVPTLKRKFSPWEKEKIRNGTFKN